jgi:hypothetical protein
MARMPSDIQRGGVAVYSGARMPGAVDTGLDELAAGVASVARADIERRAAEREAGDQVALQGAITQWRADEVRRLVEDADATPDGDVDGFEDRFGAGHETRLAERVAALPERLRPAFTERALSLRGDLLLRAGDVVRGRREAIDTRALDQQLDAAGRALMADPTQFPAVMAEAEAALAASRLPEAQKGARLAKLAPGLAVRRFAGLIESDPAAALAELQQDSWKAVLTVEQHGELTKVAAQERAAKEREAAAALQPLLDRLSNDVLNDPNAFTAKMGELRAAPELMRLSPESREKVVRGAADRLAEARLVRVGGQNPLLARGELLSGQHDAYLNPDTKQRMLSAFDGELQRRREERQRAAEQQAAIQRALRAVDLKQEMDSEVASIEATGQGVGVSLAEVAEVIGPAQAKAFGQDVARARGLYARVAPLRDLPPDKVRAAVAAAAPKPGAKDFAQAQADFKVFQRAVEAELALRQTDPAGAALRHPGVMREWRGWVEKPDDATALRNAITSMRWQQDKLGVPQAAQRLLPANLRDAYAARIKAGPKEAFAVAQELQLFGAERGRVMAEVAAAAQDESFAAMAAANPAAQRRIADAVAAPAPELKDGAKRQVRDALAAELAPLRRSWAASANGGAHVDRLAAAAARVAAQDVAAGQDPQAAARQAARLFTEQYTFRDGLRIPRGVPAGDVLVGAAYLLEERRKAGGVRLPAGDPRLKGEAAERAMQVAIAADTYWTTSPDDSGLVLMDRVTRAPVAAADGAAILIPWADAAAAAKPARDAEYMRRRSGG